MRGFGTLNHGGCEWSLAGRNAASRDGYGAAQGRQLLRIGSGVRPAHHDGWKNPDRKLSQSNQARHRQASNPRQLHDVHTVDPPDDSPVFPASGWLTPETDSRRREAEPTTAANPQDT